MKKNIETGRKTYQTPYYWNILDSVAMAIADVFSKNGYTIPNKNAKILKIFERLETLKGQWVISWR